MIARMTPQEPPATMKCSTTLLLVCAVSLSGCADRVDREKFSAISRAGHALKLHVASTGCGGVTEPCTKLVNAFALEAAALQGRAGNPNATAS